MFHSEGPAGDPIAHTGNRRNFLERIVELAGTTALAAGAALAPHAVRAQDGGRKCCVYDCGRAVRTRCVAERRDCPKLSSFQGEPCIFREHYPVRTCGEC